MNNKVFNLTPSFKSNVFIYSIFFLEGFPYSPRSVSVMIPHIALSCVSSVLTRTNGHILTSIVCNYFTWAERRATSDEPRSQNILKWMIAATFFLSIFELAYKTAENEHFTISGFSYINLRLSGFRKKGKILRINM